MAIHFRRGNWNTDSNCADILRRVGVELPYTAQLHPIPDNYGAHESERVCRWLAKHPRFNKNPPLNPT